MRSARELTPAAIAPASAARSTRRARPSLATRRAARPHAALGAALLLALTSVLAAQIPPLPRGWAVSPDQTLLFRTDLDEATVVVVDIDPTSAGFGRVLEKIPVGGRPIGITAAPFDPNATEQVSDVLVANSALGSISIIDIPTLSVRKTISSPVLDGAWDIAMGRRETLGTPGFASGTYHAFITTRAGVAVFESGPDGVAGLGFDDVIGVVPGDATLGLLTPLNPRGGCFTEAPLDAFGDSIGAWVAHRTTEGHGVASLVLYSKDTTPGPVPVDTTVAPPSFGAKTFQVVRQFVSTHPGAGLDVALADEKLSVSNPTRLYLSMEGGVVDVFELNSGAFLGRISTTIDIPDLGPFLKP